ncbi:MAG: corrinoid ABC transporter substrate-binding protein [Syntrophorhabdaceae bacterium PtaU1.Bin034]|nr:MAG: corrinoid ABC transporter substrate-binding protein [Syntrophorhabdaceae bacterium PtaU1.Bin034]
MEKRIRKTVQILCLVILLLWSIGCTGPSTETSPDSEKTDAAKTEPTQVSGQCRVRYAKGFTVTYHDGYKVVTVFEPGRAARSKEMSTFVLVPRGTRPPDAVKGTVVETPVQRVVLRSASHVPFFSMLGLTDRIKGIAQGKYVNDPEARRLIRQGRIAEVGVGSGMTAQFNVERLLTLHPDLVLTWWTNNPAYAGHIKAKEAGFPVALMADYEEHTPLGKTEWVKFVAAFFDAEAEAERVFDDLEKRYVAMLKKVEAVRLRPTVMYGNSYQGSWYVAGGKSYFANLVRDAGGDYIWGDDEGTGSKPVNAETAVARGRNADYWLTQNQNHLSLASVLAEDNRYRLFRAFQTGHIYSNNGKVGPGGGNDYYQGTAARPDLLLADMIAILHPEVLPGHKLIWHLHLPATASGSPKAEGKEEKGTNQKKNGLWF